MISVLVYGRNDSYGYNLHKRAALSLNCISELLTDSTDELIFVDYNTPDDFPTFPEAIQDTLTDRTKDRLRVLRVRSDVHRRYADRTRLAVIEPIARNIGVRRSNEGNRWILSTNTDMIFVPHRRESLSSVVGQLPDGFYHLPRFEVPETMWESLDRRDPLTAIATVRHWSRMAHLNEVVTAAPFVRFDGPGDFQLFTRDDLFRIHGFDEDMLLGWHVDSNIAKRMHLLRGETLDVLDHLYGYHCDHTRQVTPLHRSGGTANDIETFVDSVEHAVKRSQADRWGCVDVDVEEFTLRETRNQHYITGLEKAIGAEMVEATQVPFLPETYNQLSYDPRHVLPFLADIFVNAPPGMRLGWIGGHREMFDLFTSQWAAMDFGDPLLVWDETASSLGEAVDGRCKVVDLTTLAQEADAFVFDFAGVAGGPSEGPGAEGTLDLLRLVKLAFSELVKHERERAAAGEPLRRFVGVNAIHNTYEDLVMRSVGVALTPFSSRIRHGFVLPAGPRPSDVASADGSAAAEARTSDSFADWTPLLRVGSAGKRAGAAINTRLGEVGHVVFGPYRTLGPGRYQVHVQVRPRASLPRLRRRSDKLAVVEVVSGEVLYGRQDLRIRDLMTGRTAIGFDVTFADVTASDRCEFEVRVWTSGAVQFGITRVELETVKGSL